jgi:TM2 domain-containing membrane protein YozV
MKNRTTFLLLTLFLGGIGAQRFYLGQVGLGLLCLITCYSGIPLIISIVELVVHLVKGPSYFTDYVDRLEKKRATRRAKTEAQIATAQSNRLARQESRRIVLAEKYGDDIALLVLQKQICIGMQADAVVESWGKPALVKEDRSGDKVKHRYYYGAYRNARKALSYKREVKLENGRVVGWKDL